MIRADKKTRGILARKYAEVVADREVIQKAAHNGFETGYTAGFAAAREAAAEEICKLLKVGG